MKKRPTPISTEGTTERFSRGAPDGQFISQDKRLETIKNHLQTTSFSLGSLIGKGSYGEIYHLIEKDELNSKEKLVIKILNEKDQNQQDIIFDENRGEQLGLRTDSDYVIKHSKCLYLHQGILTEQPVNGDAPIAVIMPYISGRDLNKWITHERQSGSFSIQRMNSIMLKIAEGTLSLHEAFIAHRDLKPDNVMVSEEKEIPIIMDLGTAKHYQSVNSKPETPTIGAEAYRAPEFQGNTPIIMGSFNEIGKQDVFSLGYMYYNLLLLSQTGDKPENAFLGSRSMFGVEDGHFEFFEKTPELKNYIPLLKGMLEKNPTERWNMQRVREFLESLNSIQDVLTQPPPLMGSSHSSRLNLFFGLRRPQPMLPSMLPSIGITHQPL